MILHDTFGINSQGRLTIGGADAVSLAREYGTPLYVLSEDKIRENCRVYTRAIDKYFGGRAKALFASKAMSFKEIYRIVLSEGFGTDIVSLGEMYTAQHAKFPLEEAFFHGNNKTDRDITEALDAGIGVFVADNREEIEALSREAGARGAKIKVMLRISPGIDPHTHKKVITATVDSKFGASIPTGQAMELARLILGKPGLDFIGIHTHIGSQIREIEPYIDTVDALTAFIRDVRDDCGVTLGHMNIGGGFGVSYLGDDEPFCIDSAVKAVAERIKLRSGEYGFAVPFVYLEPGRSIVATAGATLYTVGSVKEIPGYRTYISVDGSMADNPRYALYESPYTVLIADRAGEEKSLCVTLAGRCCESGDYIGEDMPVQPAKRGDILAVLCTGAYNYSMASNYNRLPKPAVVIVRDGAPRVAVRAQSYADMLAFDE